MTVRSIDNMWKRDALSLDEVAKLYETPSRRRFKLDIDRALQMLIIRMRAEASGEDNEPAPPDATNLSCTPQSPCWNCWECNDDIPRPAIQKTATRSSERYFATTRQVTSVPYVYHAYVYDRTTGKVVMGCTHRHGERVSAGP